MNKELKFFLKVIRNGAILSGIYFVSVLASGELNLEVLKPLLIFFLGYTFTELGRHYKLTPTPKNKKAQTLIFE